jgi:hypothetical protein
MHVLGLKCGITGRTSFKNAFHTHFWHFQCENQIRLLDQIRTQYTPTGDFAQVIFRTLELYSQKLSKGIPASSYIQIASAPLCNIYVCVCVCTSCFLMFFFFLLLPCHALELLLVSGGRASTIRRHLQRKSLYSGQDRANIMICLGVLCND